jgi:Phosphoesterase family
MGLCPRADARVDAGGPPRAWAQSGLDQVNHIVIVMQENHSFDNYFGVLPLATGTPYHPGVVLSKLCSLAIAASQPIEYKQYLYEIFEKKHDMECTTPILTLGRNPGRSTQRAAPAGEMKPCLC